MCVRRCKRLFCCLSGGGGTRAPSSSSPLRTIGPTQSAGRVWLEGGSDAKGTGFGRLGRERRARGAKEKRKKKGVLSLENGSRGEKASSCVEGANKRNRDLVNNFNLAYVQNCSRLRVSSCVEASERRLREKSCV